jgi:hypothetical protein
MLMAIGSAQKRKASERKEQTASFTGYTHATNLRRGLEPDLESIAG